jgi:tetratricopeptide (TPR) repeat protein
MLVNAAEGCFANGMRSLSEGRLRQALALFESAISLERQLGESRPQARYLSYYGLCLALAQDETREALRFCREAVTIEGYNADLRLNLGRVLMAAGRKKEAFETFRKGLELDRHHVGLRRALRSMGLRRRPALPFLGRSHPLNVLLGRLRNRGVEDKRAVVPRAGAESAHGPSRASQG